MAALSVARHDTFAVLEVQALAGLVAVPHHALRGEADHATSAAEVDQRHDLRVLPRSGDPGGHPEPRGVPGTAPRLTRVERNELAPASFRHRDRLAVHVMCGDFERDPIAVDRRAHQAFQHPFDPVPGAAAIVVHRSKLRQRPGRAKLTLI